MPFDISMNGLCSFFRNDILLEDILRELASALKTDTAAPLSKFNISRGQLWDGTVRAVQRKSFSPENKISVKFTDDSGMAEGAIDLGGPQRELFTLVMHYLANSQMFCCGKERNEKVLNNFSKGQFTKKKKNYKGVKYVSSMFTFFYSYCIRLCKMVTTYHCIWLVLFYKRNRS